MIPDSLNSFLQILYEHDALQRISEPVAAELEIAAIVDRVCKGQTLNKALLFDNVNESLLPVAVNVFGSKERMALALGVESIEKLAQKFRLDLDSVGAASSGLALKDVVGRVVRENDREGLPECQALESIAGMHLLPALKSWPFDGGRYLTLGQVFTRSPENPKFNCGIYRIQVIDSRTALLRCYPGSGGADHIRAWHKMDKAMPVAIVLGGPPALTWAAGVSLPDSIAETDFIHYLTGTPIPLCQTASGTFKVPASAEIVIEGTVPPGEEMLEGPFGNHTGQYTPPTPAPVIKVDSIRVKADAIYPCTVVGPPPMENGCMAAAAERILLQLLQYDHPWVSDVHMPVEGIYHRAALVTIAEQANLNLADIQQAMLSSRLLRNSRLLVLLDESTDSENLRQVYWHIVNKMNCTQHADGVIVDARRSQGTIQVQHNPVIEGLVSTKWPKYDL